MLLQNRHPLQWTPKDFWSSFRNRLNFWRHFLPFSNNKPNRACAKCVPNGKNVKKRFLYTYVCHSQKSRFPERMKSERTKKKKRRNP